VDRYGGGEVEAGGDLTRKQPTAITRPLSTPTKMNDTLSRNDFIPTSKFHKRQYMISRPSFSPYPRGIKNTILDIASVVP
jgi:hypothetical protein